MLIGNIDSFVCYPHALPFLVQFEINEETLYGLTFVLMNVVVTAWNCFICCKSL